MPELPEVETTTRGLQKEIVGLKILNVWTDLNTKDKRKSDSVANTTFFKYFQKSVRNRTITRVERRAKNILINLNNSQTILIHLKMTGHLLYGEYKKSHNKWTPVKEGPLKDPFNRFVHVVFTFSNKKHLAFSDARKFGKMTLLATKTIYDSKHLNTIGIEPFDKKLTLKKFKEKLNQKPKGKIKTVLMDQSLVVGIGNIYSDEILWHSDVHPEKIVKAIHSREFEKMYRNMKLLLKKGITFGGDSMSDYRNIYGLPGAFQMHHMAYQRKGEKCSKKNCKGIIERTVINSRSAHFCSVHQKY